MRKTVQLTYGSLSSVTYKAAVHDALGAHTLLLMWRLRQQAGRAFEPLGVTPIQAVLIEYLAQGQTRPKLLAELLETQFATVSGMLLKLEKSGLVTRTQDASDGRRVQVALTPQGHTLHERVRQAWNHVIAAESQRHPAREASAPSTKRIPCVSRLGSG